MLQNASRSLSCTLGYS